MNEKGVATLVAEDNATKVASPKGYKQTKVGVIPEEWEALPAKNYFEKSIEKGYDGLEIYSVTLNKSWQKRSELEREIGSDVDAKKSLLAREGYLVYNTMRMWQGALGLAENTGVISPAYVVLKPKTTIDPKFAFYQLKSYRYLHYLKSYSYGLTSDRLRLYFNDFGMIPFVCPPLKEQQKIAQILTTWDRAISKQEALIAEKEQLKKGLMQKLLSGEVRFEGFDGEWEETPLKKVLKERKTFLEKGLSLEHVSLTTEGVVPKNARYERDFLVKGDNKKYKITRLNDICYNPANLKFGVICRNTLGDGIFSPIYVTFEVQKDFDIGFISYLLTWNDFIQRIRKYEQGTVYERMAVSPKDFLLYKIKIPPKQEQQKIAQLLTTADKEIELLKEELEALKEQKRGLMQRLLTGEVRVKV